MQPSYRSLRQIIVYTDLETQKKHVNCLYATQFFLVRSKRQLTEKLIRSGGPDGLQLLHDDLQVLGVLLLAEARRERVGHAPLEVARHCRVHDLLVLDDLLRNLAVLLLHAEH